jgi:diguanylate cyclase (GGDEF)-like protein
MYAVSRGRPRQDNATLMIVLLTLTFALWIALRPAGRATLVLGDNIGQDLLEGVGLLLALSGGIRPPALFDHAPGTYRPGARAQRWVPALLALGVLGHLVGHVIWTINESVLHLNMHVASWADVGFIASLPCLLLAVLLLPSRPLPVTTRVRTVLDSLVIATAVAAFGWYFLLGPIMLRGHDPLWLKLPGVLYPLANLVLLCCVLLLLVRSWERALLPAIIPGLLGFGIISAATAVYGYQELHLGYETGTLLDCCWPLGFMLIGLGAGRLGRCHAARGEIAHPALAPTTEPSLWRMALPALPVPAIDVLLTYAWWTGGHGPLEMGLFVGAGLLTALVLLRQIVAMRELHAMYSHNEELDAANAQLELLASMDSLTQLANRNRLHDRLSQALALAAANRLPLGLLLLDLDRFKEVNDTLGHQAGDELLAQVAARLRGVVRRSDTVARLGGDEFAVVLLGVDAEGASSVARSIRAMLEAPVTIAGQAISVGASVGIALAPEHGANGDALLQHADMAMYAAKHGRLGQAVYDPARHARSAGGAAMAQDHAFAQPVPAQEPDPWLRGVGMLAESRRPSTADAVQPS